jgi:hypothetical protein
MIFHRKMKRKYVKSSTRLCSGGARYMQSWNKCSIVLDIFLKFEFIKTDECKLNVTNSGM